VAAAQAAPAVELSAQELLGKGKAAQTAGKPVEALSYFIRAANLDSSLTEAAELVNVTTANISSGNIGADTRNAIAWRKAWVALLDECDQYVANYVKTTPLPTCLVYSTDIQQGAIDWDKGTTAISFDITLSPDMNWPIPITGVINAVYAGLVGTGQRETWKLDWPVKKASGNVIEIGPPAAMQVLQKVDVKYDVAVQLLNEKGAVIGRQNVTLSAGWQISFFRFGQAIAVISQPNVSVTFPAVDANKITENLTIKVVSLDGKSAESAARDKQVSILTAVNYMKTILGREYQTGDIGPAGGTMLCIGPGRILEIAPRSTEPSESMNWENAVEICASLKTNGIGGWRLPTKEELSAMYELYRRGLGDFPGNNYYWSSEESGYDWGNDTAWAQYFDPGKGARSPTKTDKDAWGGLRFRAVRAVGAQDAKPAAGKAAQRQSRVYQVGETGPAGGTVFIVDGQRMEAAPVSTEFKANWNDATKRCAEMKVNGIGGWHLPTMEELDAMYQQLHEQGLGGFSDTDYWSSSEYYSWDAWVRGLTSGRSGSNYKDVENSVRAVRAF